MLKIKKFFYLGIVLTTLTACPQDDPEPVSLEYFKFGHFYGQCGGENCVEVFKIEGDQLFEDTQDQYPVNQSNSEDFVQQSTALYEKVKDLPSHLPEQLLAENRTVIGSPDVVDAGGIYLEIKKNGVVKSYYIDKTRTNVPDYLHSFLDKVEAGIAVLQ